MPLSKNQIIELEIQALSNDGNGIGRFDGQVVFVPCAAPGDRLQVRVVKVLSRHAFGRVEKILRPGPGRIAADCPAFGPCGGCALRHITYEAECEAKTRFVRDAFTRLGGLAVNVSPIVPAPQTTRYRNKVQLPVGRDSSGRIVTGFYAGRSHRIVPCRDCKLQPEWMNDLAARACELFELYGIEPYNEESHSGLVRHLYLRQGWHSGQRLACFVLNGKALPHEKAICAGLQQEFDLTTVLANENTARTNVILGSRTRTVLGPGLIEDVLARVPLKMGVHEFYQVNTPAAEALYARVRRLAALQPDDFLLDLYCGMGSIGLSMIQECGRLAGVEVVPQAVEEARLTAQRMGLPAGRAEFCCMDAGTAAARFAAEGRRPNVVVVDPPRKGCSAEALQAIVQMSPRSIVMVSCNPATAARDARILVDSGYHVQDVQPFDLFPRTKHVETIVLLSKGEIDSKKVRVEFSL